MDKTAELLDRIAALELRVAQLEARPQPAQPVSGTVMANWPWPTMTPPPAIMNIQQPSYPWWSHLVPSADGTLARVTVTGDNVSRETSKGPNGAGGPK